MSGKPETAVATANNWAIMVCIHVSYLNIDIRTASHMIIGQLK
jgi:hypothetical protein